MEPVTPEEEVAPLWSREPIKMLFWVASGVTFVAALILELVVSVADLVPDRMKGGVQLTILIATGLSIGGARIVAILGRDRVWAPATVVGQEPADLGDEPPLPELEAMKSYEALREGGLSEAEARGTVWPDEPPLSIEHADPE